MISAIISAAAVVTAIGLVCAAVLVAAATFMSVRENETEKKIRQCLPGANCGACGYTGCDGYAKALADGNAKTNLCIPGADAVSRKISDLLGVEFEDTEERVAAVRCCGDCTKTEKKAVYSGIESCAAAKLVFGGDNACAFGCLGRGDCAAVCPYGAVCLDSGIAKIDTRKCVGCGLCVGACPQKIIQLMPDVKRQVVACSNKQKGTDAAKVCRASCIGCGLCAKACPVGAVTVTDNLASVNYGLCTGCGSCAAACRRGCIKTADFSGKHRVTTGADDD